MKKEFCCFDTEKGDFLQFEFTLKEEIDERKVVEFFNQFYAVKMDGTYATTSEFGRDNNIVNLKEEFMKLLKWNQQDEIDILNFESIYSLFDTDQQRKNLKLASLIQQFMNMFTISLVCRYPQSTFLELEKIADTRIFDEESPRFEQERRSSYFNTKMMMLIQYKFFKEEEPKQLCKK